MYSNNSRGSRNHLGGRSSTRWKGGTTLQESGPPFGAVMDTLTYEQVQDTLPRGKAPRITGGGYMASFNWLRKDTPTIVVPGLPPKWTPHNHPPQLPEDSGDFFRDVNASQYPKHPIEPAVRAVLAQNPDLNADKVDLFACGSTMGNLLRFARRNDEKFRFVVEVVGSTAFFIRRENSPDEKILGVRGYGHTMPKAYTKLDECVRESVSHQRLIRYEFGGFECIVRCEGDGYLKDKAKESSPGFHHLVETEGLRIIAGGKVISQEAMFDIKTRSVRRKGEDILAGEIDRLWLRQIRNFIVAYHRSGTFDDIQIIDVGKQIAQWETEHADDLRTFSAVIEKIVTYSRSQAGTVFEVCSQRPQILEFRRLGGQFNPVLPDELRHVWSQSGLASAETSEEEDSDGYVGSDAEGGVNLGSIGDSDNDAEPDYTACMERCGYCGRCKY